MLYSSSAKFNQQVRINQMDELRRVFRAYALSGNLFRAARTRNPSAPQGWIRMCSWPLIRRIPVAFAVLFSVDSAGEEKRKAASVATNDAFILGRSCDNPQPVYCTVP